MLEPVTSKGPTTLSSNDTVPDAGFMNTSPPNSSLMSDTELEDRVRLELKWTPGLDMTRLRILATEGRVTLTGTVVDFSQIEIAERAIWKVAGVVALAQNIGVQSDTLPISDSDIAHDLVAALAHTSEIPTGAVHTTVTHGCVFMNGVVPWDFQRVAAERVSASVRGVQRVKNSIEVSPSVAAAHITEHIEAVLEEDLLVELQHISISADGSGNVVLAGTARSANEISEVERATRSAQGVHTVKNLLHVTSRGRRSTCA